MNRTHGAKRGRQGRPAGPLYGIRAGAFAPNPRKEQTVSVERTTTLLTIGFLSFVLALHSGAATVSAMGTAAGAPSANSATATTDPIQKLETYLDAPEAVEKGRQIYGNTCLFCHGPKGVGARAPNLVEGMFKPGRDGEIPYAFDVIRNGRPGTIMGSFAGTITEDEIWQVMAYLRDQGRQVIEARRKRLEAR